jgi:hypothetical protein
MIFKVEVLRAWDSGWDIAWINVWHEIEYWHGIESQLAIDVVRAWVKEEQPVGLKHAAPIHYEWVKSDLEFEERVRNTKPPGEQKFPSRGENF